MWAYMTIKKMLDQANFATVSADTKSELTQKALEMSLKAGEYIVQLFE
jgi:hypothetical protein